MLVVPHIIAGIDPRHGGPSYSVPRLSAALRSVGCEARILTLHEDGTPEHRHIETHPQILAHVPGLASLRLSPSLRYGVLSAARTADVIHSHGMWLMPNVYAGWAAKRAGKPLMVSPRGMLAPAALGFSRRRKQAFWSLLQGPSYSAVAAWHATCEAEAKEIRAFGLRGPIAIIPNGIDVPVQALPTAQSELRLRRTVLFLSRLHPKKNLSTLVEAWAAVAPEHPDWDLVVAGPDQGGHRAEIEALAQALRAPRIQFPGPLYGSDKIEALTRADLFVLPTLNENFGLVIGEALAAGVPAIATKGTPWAGLEAERCGWWIDQGVRALVGALNSAMRLPSEERAEMGARGRDWMERDFGWQRIGEELHGVYRWLSHGGDLPSTVELD